MARAIDGNWLYEKVEARYRVSTGIEHRCERDFLDLICNAPTLTPPNEPMTCDGCIYNHNRNDYCDYCIRRSHVSDYYRRPPEGEV